MEVQILKKTKEELNAMGVFDWPVWSKEISVFDWFYDSEEQCYLLEGEVEVKTPSGTVSFKAGDFVIFPKGLKCVWNIKKPVRKHYNFV